MFKISHATLNTTELREKLVTLEDVHPPHLKISESKILHDLVKSLQKKATGKKVAIYS